MQLKIKDPLTNTRLRAAMQKKHENAASKINQRSI